MRLLKKIVRQFFILILELVVVTNCPPPPLYCSLVGGEPRLEGKPSVSNLQLRRKHFCAPKTDPQDIRYLLSMSNQTWRQVGTLTCQVCNCIENTFERSIDATDYKRTPRYPISMPNFQFRYNSFISGEVKALKLEKGHQPRDKWAWLHKKIFWDNEEPL